MQLCHEIVIQLSITQSYESVFAWMNIKINLGSFIELFIENLRDNMVF